MSTSKTPAPSKAAVQNAQDTWDSFVSISKVSLYAIITVLVLLWFFLIAL